MTSQVVLANGLGLALASDSAVTTGNRVINSYEKIFPLPEPHKLAVMFSNNSCFMWVPWESLLSEWTKSLSNPLPTLNEYWQSLNNWLSTRFSEENAQTNAENSLVAQKIRTCEQNFFSNMIYPFVEEHLNGNLDLIELAEYASVEPPRDLLNKVEQLFTPELFEKLHSRIEDNWNSFMSTSESAHLTDLSPYFAKLQKYIQSNSDDFDSQVLSRYPKSPKLKELFLRYVANWLSAKDCTLESVLCFAGFGESDLLPSIFRVSTYCVLDGNLQWADDFEHQLIVNSAFEFLGQKNAIETLVLGYDEFVFREVDAYDKKIRRFRETMMGDSTRLRLRVDENIEELNLFDRLTERSWEERIEPLGKIISASPIKSLAEFAKSLVQIQSAFASIPRATQLLAVLSM